MPRAPTVAQHPYYHTRCGRGQRVICDSPGAIRRYLHEEAVPSGPYEILMSTGGLAALETHSVRWGVAVKHPDGSVELMPDRPDDR
jgi:hypothetical protein